MHLIATIPGGWNPNDEGVFYIEQEPGDLLFLSAADTELYAMNKVYTTRHAENNDIPSLRLANLTYFKQELTVDTYVDEVVSKAKIVVLKLLGGVSYFTYLCEAIIECAEENDIQVIFLPGDAKPDLELMQLSTVDLKTVDHLWKLLLSGGMENTASVLDSMMKLLDGTPIDIQLPESLPEYFFMNSSKELLREIPSTEGSWSLICSYRSYFQSDNLEPISQLMKTLEKQGVEAYVFFAQGYRDPQLETQLLKGIGNRFPNVIINTTGFSIQSFNDANEGIFDRLNIPVIQAIVASCNRETWKEGMFGLTPTDIAMQVTLPEVDGKIITSVISFKESTGRSQLTDSEVVEYIPHSEGIQTVANHVQSWCEIQSLKNEQKRIALVLPNYPSKNSRLANGVGLDTPASTVNILKALKSQNYRISERSPEDSAALIELLTEKITNDLDTIYTKRAEVQLDKKTFFEYYNQLSEDLREKVEEQWGDPLKSPNFKNGSFLIPGVCLDNIFLSIQPSRGYNLDLEASYHSPDLPPTFAYFAYYIWLHHSFQAHAVVHVGKHGNLEWLPGKSVALSKESCFPAAILRPIPHFYPFIINDPGEGTQSKRRTHAIILDHLIPPMTRAENHGELLKLELLIDEYYEAALVDPKRTKLLKEKIEALVKSTHLQADLKSDAEDVDELMEAIDGYLCELKEAQIRGGLHVLGEVNQDKLRDLIIALHRLPQHNLKGITQAIALDEGLDFDPIDVKYEESCSIEIRGISCRSYGQAVEVLEVYAQRLIEDLLEGKGLEEINVKSETQNVLSFISDNTLSLIGDTKNEIGNLLKGLSGKYVPAGGSGAPTRGRLDILPTGRNFYSVDVRTVPSESAYQLGQKSAKNIVERYLQENGEFPVAVGISVWGTSTMRTSGDDIAQGLALMGVRPIWQGANRRVKDFEVISLMELKRPRIDVTLRISGFFRDAFPDVISLFNSAVEKVASLDEPLDQNPIRARYM
ncbi:MAG: cobaltochelatase subunit CobN, partial [Crocinitomicaceae bacterium]|nr:cobaltochelatase subunit CobN [Crocinitomicaceae bacterium]